MLKLKAHKVRIYPNKVQKEQINNTINAARFIYNQFLGLNKEKLSNKEYKLKYIEESKILTQLKNEHTWLKNADKFSLQNAIKDQDMGFTHFFAKRNGFPKFHSKRNNKQSYRTNLTNKNIEIKGKYIKLPKLKFVKFSKHQDIEGHIQNVTIIRDNHKYYLSITVKIDIQPLPKNNTKIGIDLGIRSFAYTKNNEGIFEDIKHPKHLEKSLKKLKKVSRQLSKKQHPKTKGDKTIKSNRYVKKQYQLNKLQQHISNQRKDFLHKLSTRIINENQIIGLEDLEVSAMIKNKLLSRYIGQSGWRNFRLMLEYKADWYGREIVIHDRYFASSKLCTCGVKNKNLKLSSKFWTCSSCGVKHNRDMLAAHNLIPMEQGKSTHVELLELAV